MFLASAIVLLGVTAHAEVLIGKAAPEFDLPKISGESRVSLSGLAGKIVVLHFGTGW
jgi:peroxiredoxin